MSTTLVAVIGGGQNCEHVVSLASAASVAHALPRDRYDVLSLTIAPDGVWHSGGGALEATPAASLSIALDLLSECDVVMPMVHGPRGEDGALAALCELAGVPWVGSGLRAGALAMDKWATKLVAESVGIRTARGLLVTGSTAAGLRWSGPVVVKPVAAGSSHGVSLVEREEDLAAAVAGALSVDDRVLVEEVVHGREVDVAVLATPSGGRVVGPPLEIVVSSGLFDTDRKYDGSADFRLPADVSEVEAKELADAALAMFDALGCRGVARVDFFLTAHGLVLNEVNTMPGMTERSQVPKMFAAAGLGYPDLLDTLVREALARARVVA